MSTASTTTVKEGLAGPLADVRGHKPRSLWSDAFRRLLRNKAAVVGLLFIILEIVIALAAPFVAPYHFAERSSGATTQPPSREHLLGTDGQGRDVLSRVIYGARISLSVGFIAEILILCIGVPLGLVAGYFGRWADTLLMRFVDIMYAFPDLLLMIILMTFLKATLPSAQDGPLLVMRRFWEWSGGTAGIFLALAITSWLTLSRLVRGETLALKRREFIEAAHCIGATNGQVMRRHLLPNVLAPIIVSATLGVPAAILAEAGLSFIGIGVNPPTPSWGQMIFDGLGGLRSVPHLVMAPAAALGLTVLSFNFLGDGLRDALDPRMKS
jgi:oligopeptide transport system permease protein